MFSSETLSLPTTVTIADTDIGNIMEFRNNTNDMAHCRNIETPRVKSFEISDEST